MDREAAEYEEDVVADFVPGHEISVGEVLDIVPEIAAEAVVAGGIQEHDAAVDGLGDASGRGAAALIFHVAGPEFFLAAGHAERQQQECR